MNFWKKGLTWNIVNLPIRVIEFQSLNRKYRGIGIENSKKGYEFYNRSLMQYPVSVGEKGLTIVSGGINNDIAFCFMTLWIIWLGALIWQHRKKH